MFLLHRPAPWAKAVLCVAAVSLQIISVTRGGQLALISSVILGLCLGTPGLQQKTRLNDTSGQVSLGHTTRLKGKLAVPIGDTSFPLFGLVHKVVFKDVFYFVFVYPPPGGPDGH